jgi:pyruvate dehydrogenase E1 component alpha subunit/2-oxoisovalerate dehydrogenase E1 component alpha subunit
MRLTRTLEERLVALYRQTKVVGGLFRSLGQEADAVGSAFALERRDILSPLIRNLGAMLVKGATPVEILRQYMAKGDSPTRGRELNIHFGDTDRGFIGQISPLGDMVPVMAGVTLSFKMRGEDRVGLVYVGDGATSTGAFHEGFNFAAVQCCPLVVIVENNGYAYSTPIAKQTAAKQFVDKAIGYGVPGVQADGNDVLAVYDATKPAVDRARAGGGVTLIELMTYRRKGHAEHDNQSYVPPGEIERWERENDPLTRYVARLTGELGFGESDIAGVDQRVRAEVDAATETAEASPTPAALDALIGIYADPPAEQPLWFREGVRSAVDTHERAQGWGTFDTKPASGGD